MSDVADEAGEGSVRDKRETNQRSEIRIYSFEGRILPFSLAKGNLLEFGA